VFVKQLIARIDDGLHARLKERAAAEGRSLNALVVEALEAAAASGDRRAELRAQARAAGVLVVPPRPAGTGHREDVWKMTRGAGTAASEALSAERASR
jgi:plasmid stability protein